MSDSAFTPETNRMDQPTVDTADVTFNGDTGSLPVDTRRVLVQLLLGPSVDGHRQTKLWPLLLRDEAVLKSRLHDMFLEMVIDHDQKVAFTRQVVAENIDAPVLLRRSPLTFLESALVLFLRKRMTHADAQGERAVVSMVEMCEYLKVFERDKNVDHARFERQMEKSVEKAKTLSLLHKLKGGEDRFEVSPTLKLLFSAEEIQALTRTYQALAEAVQSGDGQDESEQDTPSYGEDDEKEQR